MTAAERRQTPRTPVEIAVELRRDADMLLLKSHDISEGGAFFDRAIPHAVGTQVKVRLDLPGEGPLECDGEVVSVRGGQLGMGVKFVNLNAGDAARLAAFARDVEQVRESEAGKTPVPRPDGSPTGG